MANWKKQGGVSGFPRCGTDKDVVVNSTANRSNRRSVQKPKKTSLFSSFQDWLEGKSAEPEQPKLRKAASASNSPALRPSGSSIYLPKPCSPSNWEGFRNHTASSSSHGDRTNDPQEADGYQIRAPPPGSYQDDDTGPSPKNLLMAVMGVKSAVNHFAKVLITDMNKHPVELEYLKQTILREVKSQVDRANHWKFLVQAFICKRLFDGFDSPNGYFGIEDFKDDRMSTIISFADFSKFKDKAGTISMLMDSDSPDRSFLGRFCFKKFKSISGELATNQPLPIYKEEWHMVESGRHPRTVFYQSFLKVAVSVWLLHRLVHSFEQRVEMLTYGKGSKFQRKNMESVVPGGYEEEDEENDLNTEVGFSVIPGFQVSRSVVKCEVYLRNKNRHPEMETTGRTSIDKTPAKTSINKTPVKTLSNRTSVPLHTPEMPVIDNNSFGSLQTPEGFSSYSNVAEHLSPRVEDTVISAPVVEAGKYWNSQRQSLSPGNQGTASRSGRKSRNEQESFAEAHPVFHDRDTKVYKMAAPPSRPSNQRGPYHFARDTKMSATRRLSNTRHSPSG